MKMNIKNYNRVLAKICFLRNSKRYIEQGQQQNASRSQEEPLLDLIRYVGGVINKTE